MKQWLIFMALSAAVFGCAKADAARPTQHSCFHKGHMPAYSCTRGFYEPTEQQLRDCERYDIYGHHVVLKAQKRIKEQNAHRKPSDRKLPEYPTPPK